MNIKETNKFANQVVSIRTFLPLEKETITALNLAIMMMKTKTERYPTRRDLLLALSDAYDLKYSVRLIGHGSVLVLDQTFILLNGEVPDPLYVEKCLTLMDQLLFHPLLDEEGFEEARYLMESHLRRLQDDGDYVSSASCLELLSPSHLAIDLHGDLQDLQNVRFEQVKECALQAINCPKTFLVCGNPDVRIKAYLSGLETSFEWIRADSLFASEEFKNVTKKKDLVQTSLCQAYSTSIGFDDPLYDAQELALEILGRAPDNLLYREVREKRGLCYSITASLIRYDAVLMVQAGIRKENADTVLSCIDEQIDRLVSMDYDDSLLDAAKKDRIDILNAVNDDPSTIVAVAFADRLLNRRDPLSRRMERIQSVTKEQISQAASRFKKVALAVVEGSDEDE